MANNIIFYFTDQQRWDTCGCYGQPLDITPNLDALAAEGVKFENAFSPQPVCGPCRALFQTGRYPTETGCFRNNIMLPKGIKTLGEYMEQDAGYETAYIGKWHLDGGDYFGLGRCPDGWDPDYWYDMKCYLDELTPEERLKSRNPATCDEGIDEGFTFGHRCADRAIDFVEKYNDEDFFLALSLDEPHGPFLCPEPYASMFKGYEFPKRPNVWDTLEGKPFYQKLWAGDAQNREDILYLEKLPLFHPDGTVME